MTVVKVKLGDLRIKNQKSVMQSDIQPRIKTETAVKMTAAVLQEAELLHRAQGESSLRSHSRGIMIKFATKSEIAREPEI